MPIVWRSPRASRGPRPSVWCGAATGRIPPTPVDKKPDDAVLFDLLAVWVPDAAARHKVLVENPAALYDFSHRLNTQGGPATKRRMPPSTMRLQWRDRLDEAPKINSNRVATGMWSPVRPTNPEIRYAASRGADDARLRCRRAVRGRGGREGLSLVRALVRWRAYPPRGSSEKSLPSSSSGSVHSRKALPARSRWTDRDRCWCAPSRGRWST